jgi:hypothetical protein
MVQHPDGTKPNSDRRSSTAAIRRQEQSRSGENMRYPIFVVLVALAFSACKHNSVAPSANENLSQSATLGDIRYTLSIPQRSFGIHDTLSETFTAYNQSSHADTLYAGYGPYFFSWSLTNASGRTIMFGPIFANNLIRMIPLNPNQSAVMYAIRQAIADTSGAPVVAGSYSLRWNLNSQTTTLLSVSLSLTLQ